MSRARAAAVARVVRGSWQLAQRASLAVERRNWPEWPEPMEPPPRQLWPPRLIGDPTVDGDDR